jgi:hypothetical protein
MPSNTNEHTEREEKALELYKQGKSTRYIAEMLCNPLNAVLKHHFSDILALSATHTCIISTWFGGIKNAGSGEPDMSYVMRNC